MSTAAIKCLHAEVWPIARFIPHPKNPNRHPEAQIDLLAKIIILRGWRRPIVVSSRSGYVVKGHGRLAAAIAAGLTDAPVELQEYASDADELADMVADNRIAELSEMDGHALCEMLKEMQPGPFGRGATGFTEEEFQAMIAASEQAPDDTQGTPSLKNVGKTLRFGAKSFPLTDREFDALQQQADAHRDDTGTSYGFARTLLKMP